MVGPEPEEVAVFRLKNRLVNIVGQNPGAELRAILFLSFNELPYLFLLYSVYIVKITKLPESRPELVLFLGRYGSDASPSGPSPYMSATAMSRPHITAMSLPH